MARDWSKLKVILQKTDLQRKNQPLYQLLNTLLDLLAAMEADLAAAGSGGGTSIASVVQQILFQELSGADEFIIPGPPGRDGLAGLIGPRGMDGIDGEDALPIPGQKGDTGATGAAGMDGDCSECEPALLGIPSEVFGQGSFVEQTTTATGTNNDFALSGRRTYLRCNNASDLTITGFTIQGATPQAGDIVTLVSIGAGNVYFSHQTGSTAANRLINLVTVGPTPLAGGFGNATFMYDGTTGRWRLIGHDQGSWIAIPFDAGNFTASGAMTWTVDMADQVSYNFMVIGKKLLIQFAINGTTVGGVADQILYLTLPNGYTIASAYGNQVQMATRAYDNAVERIGSMLLVAGDTRIACFDEGFINWTLCTDNTAVQGQAFFVID